MKAFGKQGRFLKPSIHELPPSTVVAEFEKLGVPTKVEQTGKVFPISNRAIDVRDALLNRLSQFGGLIRTGVAVQDLQSLQQGDLSSWRVLIEGQEFVGDKVLLCCGGLSYSGCGTTGDGYAWAERLGHQLVATAPALTPLVSPANWVHELSGITLPDAAAQVVVPGTKIKDVRNKSRGGFLWTHFGCSGPVSMNVSRFVSQYELDKVANTNGISSESPYLELDLLPAISADDLAREFDASRGIGRKQISTILQNWLPKNLVHTLLRTSDVKPAVTLAELPKKGRNGLLRDLKQLKVPLDGTKGYPKAEVTMGGIKTSEVNPQTMESRKAKGLFLAGEILDVDGPIGGYNFQAAFSTGHAVGRNV